eukprot:TRINITY_DN6946_c0_g2_i5.p2 TRINITY_DN6946_c0_g2~~TRINITY_DN6946_c0_g2_i5.p2  ORF type:complete len:123 (+),score=27.63 TRINITY_DN6946_c0_g2_i5:88-456(+)
MESKDNSMREIAVITMNGEQIVNLRDRTRYSKLEEDLLYEIFGIDWLNEHPVIFSTTNPGRLSLDLSSFTFEPDDLQRFVSLHNNPLMLREMLIADSEELSLIHICRCRRYAVCRSRWSPYH